MRCWRKQCQVAVPCQAGNHLRRAGSLREKGTGMTAGRRCPGPRPRPRIFSSLRQVRLDLRTTEPGPGTRTGGLITWAWETAAPQAGRAFFRDIF